MDPMGTVVGVIVCHEGVSFACCVLFKAPRGVQKRHPYKKLAPLRDGQWLLLAFHGNWGYEQRIAYLHGSQNRSL